jgi:hypothetical protein
MQLNVVQTTRSVLLVEHVVIIVRRSALVQESNSTLFSISRSLIVSSPSFSLVKFHTVCCFRVSL